MQLAVVQRRYPNNINHTPRSFEFVQSEVSSHPRYRSTAIASRPEEPDLHTKGEAQAMATIAVSAISSPLPTRRPQKVLRKAPSLTIQRLPPTITRRHSWTSSTQQSARKSPLEVATMEVSGEDHVTFEDRHDSGTVLDDKPSLQSTRPGATFDMAYFVRNTGPPSALVRETAPKVEARRPVRKRNRGLFRKRKEAPETQSIASEHEKPSGFVPLEGVEQKITAKGNKYLQIIPHPDLTSFGRTHSSLSSSEPRSFASPRSDHTETVSSDALDTWISTLSSSQGHDAADYSVKAPTVDDMRAHESSTCLSLSRPRTPLSFVSEARSMLPPAENGFGLSIIDGPIMEPYCRGLPTQSPALCSNPPSDPATPEAIAHGHSTSVETAEMPLLEATSASNDVSPGARFVSYRAFPAEDNHKFSGRSNDVLAGQGLRRPAKDDADFALYDRPIPDLIPAATIQSRRNREAASRARKIKALQQARREVSIRSRGLQESSKTQVNAKNLTGVLEASDDVETPPSHSTPPRHINRLTKTMLVAEQAPLPRGRRQSHRPARLVLRESALLEDKPSEYSGCDGRSDMSPVSAVRLCTPTRPPPSIPTKSSARATLTPSSLTSPLSLAAKHHSTPLLSTNTAGLTPQAVTATATLAGGIRTSVCSSHTSSSKEARLEARLEALERENRLLEAALMAVLKTSGTLNRCPCVVLKERSDTHTKETEHLSPLNVKPESPRSALAHQNGSGVDLRRGGAARAGAAKAPTPSDSSSVSSTHPHRGSVDSSGSGLSALEVYLRTKIGADGK